MGTRPDIEITEAMIAAGARAVLHDPMIDVSVAWAEALTAEVLKYALAARHLKPRPELSEFIIFSSGNGYGD